MYIRPLDLGGALEQTFTLASSYATIVCFMVRPWSRTQFKGRCHRKEHSNRKVLYLKLIRQVSIFLKIFRAQFYSNSREDCCKAIKKKLCCWPVNVEVSNTQATEQVGCLSQEASMSSVFRQRVKMSVVGSVSSFASNAKGGQSFQLQSPHIFLK